MALLDLILNRKNVTFDWVERPELRLVVDLDRHSFCGVAIGEPIGGLSALGPADDRRRQGAVLDYSRRGFYLVYDRHPPRLLTGIIISITSDPPAVRPFAGAWRWRGRDLPLSPDTSPRRLIELLGQPPFHQNRDDVTDELVLFYEHAAAEWQFVFDLQSRLTSLEILRDAELQDAASRAAYGCTKPWPF